jgi:hypothetical protein
MGKSHYLSKKVSGNLITVNYVVAGVVALVAIMIGSSSTITLAYAQEAITASRCTATCCSTRWKGTR